MHLKTLKITGFKSFKDPISLEFSKGIAGIVGPNGSGKSNITDAIKWVLGEQSIKSLRGKKMEDVIFSGTERRPPSAYAEVVLVLDNRDRELDDFKDYLEIGRKLYRSGESDYYLNKKSCKLREIQDIFMDTGLGKNGYSLISQGGIEKIVASSPLELRAVFEEAVGIVSYKNKKNEAEKKLDLTRDHMERILDILNEIKKQLTPLKKQAEKAKEYQNLAEELKTVAIVLFVEQMNDSLERLAALTKQLQEQVHSCEKFDRLINQLDQKYQKLTNENRLIAGEREKHRRDQREIKNKLEIIQERNIRISSQIEANSISQERLQREEKKICEEEWKNEILRNDYLKEVDLFKKKQKNIVTRQKVLATDLEALLNDEALEKKRLKENRERSLNEKKRNEELKESHREIAGKIQIIDQQLDLIKQGLGERLETLSRSDLRLDSLKDELLEATKLRDQLSFEQEQLARQHRQTEGKYQAIVAKIQDEDNKINLDQSKIGYLKNIQANYQDYFPAIQKIMKSAQELGSAHKKVYGPVGELLTTKKRYLRAIDVALGGKSQNIVVENIAVASLCIELLKKERIGRATFLPLDNLKIPSIDQQTLEKISHLQGLEGLGPDLVETEGRFLKCAQNLLGRALIIDSFENAQKAHQALNGRLTIVTLGGEIFYPGGAILGGRTKQNKESPMSKKVEINGLQALIKDRKANRQHLNKEKQVIGEVLSQEKAALTVIGEKINMIERLLWEKEEQFKNYQLQVSEVKNQLEKLENEEKKAVLAKKAFTQQALIIKAELLQTDNGMEKISSENKLELLGEMIPKKRMALEESRADQTKMEAEIRSLEKQIAFVSEHLAEKQESLGEINNKSQQYQSLNERLLKEQKEFTIESTALKKKLNELKARNNQQTFNKNSEELAILQEEIKLANHDLIIHNDLKNKILTEQKELQIKINHEEKKLFENYGMNQLMAEDFYHRYQDNPGDELLSESRQEFLKREISKLGSINLNAIASYQDLKTRHDHLDRQLKDLKQGKTELYKIINELNEAITKQFKHNFGRLQESFSRIFTTLFEGGQAYLDFTSSQEIQPGGIELIAQPPGKKLRQLSLLSGGEKSMVAIALLFAFLEINPAPFCVIDEVDAALDEQNIVRYINYLKKASRENQFITITHRRRTLEVCENLYGVSMGKDGISQLVSVRLLDYA